MFATPPKVQLHTASSSCLVVGPALIPTARVKLLALDLLHLVEEDLLALGKGSILRLRGQAGDILKQGALWSTKGNRPLWGGAALSQRGEALNLQWALGEEATAFL